MRALHAVALETGAKLLFSDFERRVGLRRLLLPEDWDGHPARKDYPVQIRKAAQTYEPLEVSEEEFKANIARDRLKRAH